MKTNRIKKLLVTGLLISLSFSTMAWGVLGHRIIGQIADSYLTRHAQKEIFSILGTESVAMASNWPDFIKSDPAYSYLSPWHYVNLKPGMKAEEVKAFLDADTATDAYTKINFLVAELKKQDLPQVSKVLYLRLLIHIVGDVHQPMHVGRLDDLGGNKIKVLWFNNPFNLHQIWDEKLVEFQQLSYTEYTGAINHTTKAERKEWQSEPLSDWIYQSYQYAEKIYADIKQPEEKLSYQYNFKYISIVNQQLLKGGVHLAGLLNDIFG
jgi:hypothetical protein